MTGYGDSFYGSDWYTGSPYRANTELRVGIVARIVKPPRSAPPVIDSIAYGLAQRFDYLQQGIQAFALFNKIEFAKGESDGFLPSLDDVWGKIYSLPRRTGESDHDYRVRLQTYTKVLTGCGTAQTSQEVLDFLIGLPGATTVQSVWPAQANIEFNSVDAMRLATRKLDLLNSVLPGMFAAGVDYHLQLFYLDCYVKAAIKGDATLPYISRAAIATENELSCGVDALVAYGRELAAIISASVQTTRDLWLPMRAAIRADRLLEPSIISAIRGNPVLSVEMRAAVQGEPWLSCSYYAAIQGEPQLDIETRAAVARDFDLPCSILARVVFMYELETAIKAAVSGRRELSVGIRARIARGGA